MSAPSHDDDQLKLEIFDSFSKTVMRNASRNFAAAAKTRRKNESVNTDIVQYILKTHGENAVYPSEHFIDAGNGYCCVVATEWLYQAMLLLPPKQKEVVILEFWYGMSISEISETLRISRRSVSERKKTHLQIFAVITKGHKSMKLDYETVYRAVKGDHDAQEKLLQYYDAYISALSTVVEICSDGTEHQYVCEDQKAEIQTKYLEALSKCKVIK